MLKLTHQEATSLRHYSYRPGTAERLKALFVRGLIDPTRHLTRVGIQALEEYDKEFAVVRKADLERVIALAKRRHREDLHDPDASETISHDAAALSRLEQALEGKC